MKRVCIVAQHGTAVAAEVWVLFLDPPAIPLFAVVVLEAARALHARVVHGSRGGDAGVCVCELGYVLVATETEGPQTCVACTPGYVRD